MEVTALRDHTNHFGKKYQKVRGDEYTHPRPEGDLKSKVVAEHGSDEARQAIADKAKKAAEETAAPDLQKPNDKTKSSAKK